MPAKPPINLKLNIRLQPKQLELYRLFETYGIKAPPMLGYGGSLGGGKSFGIRGIMLIRRLQFGRTNGVIFRRVYKDLRDNHIEPFLQAYPALRDMYRSTDHEIVLPNDSKIQFRFAETQEDVERATTGIEWFDIMLDQAEQFMREEILWIQTRNRWTEYFQRDESLKEGGRMVPVPEGACKMALFFNPGGKSAPYLRRVFYLRQYSENEQPHEYRFIQAHGWDNYQWASGAGISESDYYALKGECDAFPEDRPCPDLPCCRFHYFIRKTQYGRTLNALPASMRAGHLIGSFDSFAGQYYSDVWDEEKIITPVRDVNRIVQSWWKRWIALDWGFSDHAAAHWGAIGRLSPTQMLEIFGVEVNLAVDIVVVYRELLVHGMGEPELAQTICDMTPDGERPNLKEIYMSPDAWNVRGSQNTAADLLAATFSLNRFPTPEKSNNDRIGGWRTIWNGLKQTCSILSEQPEVTPGIPMLVISADCVELQQAMPLLVRDPKKPNDVQKMPSTNDPTEDVTDSFRYLIHSKLSPRTVAPAAVRLAEKVKDLVHPNQVAMVTRQFVEREKKRTMAHARPRWRS